MSLCAQRILCALLKRLPRLCYHADNFLGLWHKTPNPHALNLACQLSSQEVKSVLAAVALSDCIVNILREKRYA